ncbi:MAG: ComF family protein [Candidatus Veblenbacteria bacterium]|nr:ComF family protein [Candidatus Veblenbacteria bacterium]
MPKSLTLTLTQPSYALLAAAWQWLLDALFPRRCVGCRRWGSWCCAACLASLSFPRQLHCPGCQNVSPLGEWCQDCVAGQALRGLWCTQNYANPLLRNMIRALKYEGLTELAVPLGRLLSATLTTYGLPPAWHEVPRERWYLTPVPLAPRRERQRNFNQTELLAQAVSTTTNLALASVLQRVHSTKPQSELAQDEQRHSNVRGAFALQSDAQVAGNAYILVDDVYTSGATMEECARVLRAAGAREVWGLTVAKG